MLCMKEYVTACFLFHVSGGERSGRRNVVFYAQEPEMRWSGESILSEKIKWPASFV
jgi:hypothetical protein